MHVSCSYDMSYVITFDVWEVRIMSYCESVIILGFTKIYSVAEGASVWGGFCHPIGKKI